MATPAAPDSTLPQLLREPLLLLGLLALELGELALHMLLHP
ncbi:hypothetical protein JCM1841_002968, partial [Sporobolomyces salmonicolor]